MTIYFKTATHEYSRDGINYHTCNSVLLDRDASTVTFSPSDGRQPIKISPAADIVVIDTTSNAAGTFTSATLVVAVQAVFPDVNAGSDSSGNLTNLQAAAAYQPIGSYETLAHAATTYTPQSSIAYATGVDATGATDSTAAVIAAAIAAGSTSTTPTVKLPAGTFKLNLTALDRIYLEGVSSDLTKIIPASATSPIISAGGTGNLLDQRSYINKVTITTGGVDRPYIYPLIQFSFSRNVIFGDDVCFDVAGYTCLCIKFVAAFQIRLWGIQFRTGKWALPVEFRNDVVHPTTGLYQQCDTNYFDMQVDGCFAAIFRTANNESHGHNFFLKCWQSTYYPTAPSENTTLNGAHSAGATSLALTDATGVIAGDVLHIDCGLDVCEIVRVASVSGNTVTLHSSTPLLFAHLTGAEVFRGGLVASFADQYNNIKFHEFHAEGQQIGIATGNMYGVHFNAPYKGCGRLVHMAKDLKNLRVIAPIMMGTVNLNELCRHSSNFSGAGSDGPWYCEDPIVLSGAAITPTVPGSYFPHNTKPWRLLSNSGGGAASTERFNVNSGTPISTKRFMGFANGVEKLNITYGSGSALRTRNNTAADYTILATDSEYIAVTSTSSARTITLPAANAVVPGKTYLIKDESGAAATNNITISRAGTDTIEGSTSKVINTNYGSLKLYSDGTSKWFLG